MESGGAPVVVAVQLANVMSREEPMSENRHSDETGSDGTRPAAVRWLVRIGTLVAGVVVLLVLARVFVRPIPPDQEAPERHPGEPCWACHFVGERFEAVEL